LKNNLIFFSQPKPTITMGNATSLEKPSAQDKSSEALGQGKDEKGSPSKKSGEKKSLANENKSEGTGWFPWFSKKKSTQMKLPDDKNPSVRNDV
jgi:hypothetical protein